MREIKFRVWDSQQKIMYGCRNIHWENNNKITFQKGSGIEMDEKLGDVLMQFTGLKDKNDKEIYEGDIIYLAGYGNHEVVFPFIQLYDSAVENDIGKIIGNKWENPELLSQKDN